MLGRQKARMPQVCEKKKNPRFDRADAPVEDEEEDENFEDIDEDEDDYDDEDEDDDNWPTEED